MNFVYHYTFSLQPVLAQLSFGIYRSFYKGIYSTFFNSLLKCVCVCVCVGKEGLINILYQDKTYCAFYMIKINAEKSGGGVGCWR